MSAITPAPGYPTPVAAVWTPDPSATFASADAPAAPFDGTVSLSSDDLQTLTPQQLFTALAPDLATSPQTLVVGSVTGFAPPDGIVVATVADAVPDPSDSPLPLDDTDPQPATVTLHVGGTTLDGVPGGFVSLRTGDAILAGVATLGSDASAVYVTSVPGAGSQLQGYRNHLESQASRVERSRTGAARARPETAVTYTNYTPFRMEGKSPKGLDKIFLFGKFCPPLQLPLSPQFCVGGRAILNLGSFAEFPMFLDDGRNVIAPYTVNQSNDLPLTIDNDPSPYTYSQLARYSIGAFGAVVLESSLNLTLPDGTPKAFSASNKLEIGFQTSTARLLPGAGATAPVDTLSQIGGKFDLAAFICAAAASVKAPIGAIAVIDGACFENKASGANVGIPVTFKSGVADTITGGSLQTTSLSISNASPASAGAIVFPIDTDGGPSPIFPVTPLLTPQMNVVPQGVNLYGLTYLGDDDPQLTLSTQIGISAGGTTASTPALTINGPLRQIIPIADVLKTMRDVSDPVTIFLRPNTQLPVPCSSTIYYDGSPQTVKACSSFVGSMNGTVHFHGTVTVMDLSNETGTISWDPGFGHLPGPVAHAVQLAGMPPCSSAAYAGLFTVSPAMGTGPTATFDFEPVGPNAVIASSDDRYTQCVGEFYDVDGNYAKTILNWTVVPPQSGMATRRSR